MNVGKVLTSCAQRLPGKTAVVCGQERIVFHQLNLMACRVGNALRTMGVKRGDRVAIMLPNSSHFVVAYFGVLKLGAVCVPLDIRFKGEEVRGIIKDAQVKVFITSGELARYCLPLLNTLTTTPQLIVVEDEGGRVVEEGIAFERVVGDETLSEEVAVEVEPGEEALYLYTSGTTGTPKGVVLTFHNLVFFPEILGKLYGTNEQEVIGCVLPMSHLSGPILCNELVDKGCTLVIFEQLRPDKILAAIEMHGVTWFHAVPSIFLALLRTPRLNNYDLRSLRLIAMMGASVPLELLARFKALFPWVIVTQGYGLTETSPFITLVPPEYAEKKMGSIGKAVPHAEIKLIDEHGNEVPCGEVGELIVRGPMVMKGYHHNPVATSERIREGWLYTGDLCRKDDDDFYYYLGRKDDMIIVGGLNVFPYEVESVLMSHPQVREAAVIGIPDEERGESIKAFVVLEPCTVIKERELIAYCRGKLASYKVPKMIEFKDAIPKTSTGKIAKSLLITDERTLGHSTPLSSSRL